MNSLLTVLAVAMQHIRLITLLLFSGCAGSLLHAAETGQIEQSLNGEWNFTIKSDPQVDDWSTIQVPGSWNSTETYSTHFGKGWYQRQFTPDPSLQGQRVRLRFEAVYYEVEVFLNGQRLGVHVGGYTPFEFDVTDVLHFGQSNEVTVRADNTYNRGAWWKWGGINRDVTLIGNHPVRLVWQHIRSEPDLEAGTATIFVNYRIRNDGTEPQDVRIQSRLESVEGILVDEVVRVEAGKPMDRQFSFALAKADVRLWHFDATQLYYLNTRLSAANALQHAQTDRFGIRKVELTPTAIVLNGEPMRLVGFNRISDGPIPVGTTEPDAFIHQDIDLMKQSGAVMSRIFCTPQAPNFLDALDEKGMMVFTEIAVWGGDDPQTFKDNPLTKQWLREMIHRDYNHPSIIGWSVGNELVDANDYIVSMINYVREELDPHRFVTFVTHSAYRGEKSDNPIEATDIAMVNQYRDWGGWGASSDLVAERWPGKPMFFSEMGSRQLHFAGAQGHFDEDFVERWHHELTPGNPNVVGAALFSFNDYRSKWHRTPPTGFRTWGVVDEHRNLKPAYHVIRKLFSPVRELSLEGRTVTVQIRGSDEIPSYALRDYKIVWQAGDASGELPVPDLYPDAPAWKADLPVPGATIQLVTPLGYAVDDNIFILPESRQFQEGSVLDDAEAELAGSWTFSKSQKPYHGTGYRFTGKPNTPNDGSATATFRFTAPQAGSYSVMIAYSADPTRATNVPVTVTSGSHVTHFSVDQTVVHMSGGTSGGPWRTIGTAQLVDGEETLITVGSAGTTGFVILDALQLVPASDD